MKKVYIKEDRIKNISDESRLLPKHLYSLLSTHTTSLGDNKAFPVDDDYPFDYTVVKQRFIEVSDALDNLGLESRDNDSLVTELSSLVTRCKEMEEPIKDFLEKLCENTINKMFSIPDETINLTCKLVGKIKPEKPVRVLPEPIGSDSFKFKNVDDIKLSKDAVAKRRFINSLIQGAAYAYANDTSFYEEELNKLVCDEAILTDTMLESTLKIYEACDVVIFLPGGYGTVYELFTAIQSYLGGEIKQKIILYNCAGYYDKLISFLESAYKDGFILEEDYDSLVILNSVSEVVDYIKNISLNSE